MTCSENYLHLTIKCVAHYWGVKTKMIMALVGGEGSYTKAKTHLNGLEAQSCLIPTP